MRDIPIPPCHLCGNADFHTADTIIGGMAVAIRLGFFKKAAVQCRVCLTCGSIVPVVDHFSLASVRAAKAAGK